MSRFKKFIFTLFKMKIDILKTTFMLKFDNENFNFKKLILFF